VTNAKYLIDNRIKTDYLSYIIHNSFFNECYDVGRVALCNFAGAIPGQVALTWTLTQICSCIRRDYRNGQL